MCGIIGFTGKEDSVKTLIEGLEALEYRGYDSAGIAVMNNAKIELRKQQGKIQFLKEELEVNPVSGDCGIGHTRWATHGEPTQVNAHPHVDGEHNIVLVHNGIIENYAELKEMLQEKGCEFISQTDTEVAAQLLGYVYNGDIMSSLRQVMDMIKGSYALAVMCGDNEGKIYCVSKESPVVVGSNDIGSYVASDIAAMLKHTRDVYFLKTNQIAVLTKDGIEFYDAFNRKITRTPKHIEWDVEAAQKGNYEHFMLKEIYEQPEVINKIMEVYVNKEDNTIKENVFPWSKERAENIKRIRIVSCGTAYHAGMLGKEYFETLAKIPTQVEVASEFRYGPGLFDKDEEIIVISQSGETADTLAALRLAKKKGCHVTAICNVLGSTITREADDVIYTQAGPEISVAATKSYTAQITVLFLAALDVARKLGTVEEDRIETLFDELKTLPEKMNEVLLDREKVQYFASRMFSVKHVFFIGRGIDYALSMEAALKLKEISYIHSEAYPAGELKHGTIALIEENSLVIAIATQKSIREKTASNMQETKVRGAYVLALSCGEWDGARHCSQEQFELCEIDPLLAPMLSVIPLQLTAYYFALQRGCDVDKPRNLAKSVTVE